MAKPQKVKLKKSAWFGIIITLLVLILFIVQLIPTPKESVYASFQSNTDFTEDHIINKVSFNKFKKLLENSSEEKVYVLFGNVEDLTTSIDVFNDVAKDNGISKLYWFDTDDSKIDEEDEMNEFAKYLRDNVAKGVNDTDLVSKKYLTRMYLNQQQDLFVFQNGKIVNRFYDVDKKLTSADGSTKSVEFILTNYIYK